MERRLGSSWCPRLCGRSLTCFFALCMMVGYAYCWPLRECARFRGSAWRRPILLSSRVVLFQAREGDVLLAVSIRSVQDLSCFLWDHTTRFGQPATVPMITKQDRRLQLTSSSFLQDQDRTAVSMWTVPFRWFPSSSQDQAPSCRIKDLWVYRFGQLGVGSIGGRSYVCQVLVRVSLPAP